MMHPFKRSLLLLAALGVLGVAAPEAQTIVKKATQLVTSVFGRTGAVVAQTGDYSFSQISGIVDPTQLPTPTAITLGGVESLASVTHQFLTSLLTTGAFTQAQPACADLTGAAASCGTNASELSSGTLLAARLPAFTGDITTSAGSSATVLKTTGTGAGSCTNCTVTFDAQGRETAYSTGAGSACVLCLISTQTASGSTTLSWIGLGSTYNDYLVKCSNINVSASGAQPTIVLGHGGGPTYDSSYDNTGSFIVSGVQTLVSTTLDTTALLSGDTLIGSDATRTSSFTSWLYAFPFTTKHNIKTQFAGFENVTNKLFNYDGATTDNTTTPITAVQVGLTAGKNYTTSTCSLYGVAN